MFPAGPTCLIVHELNIPYPGGNTGCLIRPGSATVGCMLYSTPGTANPALILIHKENGVVGCVTLLFPL